MGKYLKVQYNGRDIRLAINNNNDTVEYAQVNTGDSVYDDWVDDTQTLDFVSGILPDGASVWFLKDPIFGLILPAPFEPADASEIEEGTIPPLAGPPVKGCLCDGEWWSCPIGNDVDCSQSNPCGGTKIVGSKK